MADFDPMKPPPFEMPRLSFEEYLNYSIEDHKWFEWVDGQVIWIPPPPIRHQRLLSFFMSFFGVYLMHRPVGMFLQSPFVTYLPHRPSARMADVIVILKENEHRLAENYYEAPPDVVVEIVSEESQKRDWGEKLTEYEAAGVPEYWLVDPLREIADFYHLGEDGLYNRIAPDADGRLPSVILAGLCVDVAWLWQDPPPSLAEALKWVGEMLAE